MPLIVKLKLPFCTASVILLLIFLASSTPAKPAEIFLSLVTFTSVIFAVMRTEGKIYDEKSENVCLVQHRELPVRKTFLATVVSLMAYLSCCGRKEVKLESLDSLKFET